MTGLKPCPFCGGKADTFHIPENTEEELARHPKWRWNHPGMWVIGCDTTLCIGNKNSVAMLFMTEKQAAKHWNRRADDD